MLITIISLRSLFSLFMFSSTIPCHLLTRSLMLSFHFFFYFIHFFFMIPWLILSFVFLARELQNHSRLVSNAGAANQSNNVRVRHRCSQSCGCPSVPTSPCTFYKATVTHLSHICVTRGTVKSYSLSVSLSLRSSPPV